MLFALKKIISGLILPSSLIFFSLLAGIVLLFLRRCRLAASVLFAGFLTALLSFFPPVPDTLIHRLENRYPPFVPAQETSPQWILVLGHGYKAGQLPQTSRVDGEMYARLMETVRIAKEFPDARIVVPLYGDAADNEKQAWLGSFCRNTGWSPAQTVILPDAPDTGAELRQALRLIGQEPFVLVTAAAHMPRAMQIATSLGGRAVAAPCDFEDRSPDPAYRFFIPSVRNLQRTEAALHEYMGILWFRITHSQSTKAR
jgi:uncharacterized SAM-binding protein YcdF (DUF218 family)